MTPNSCRVRVHGGIDYRKSIWGVVKGTVAWQNSLAEGCYLGFIEKGTQQGLEEHYIALEKSLSEEAQRRRDAGDEGVDEIW